MVLHPVKACANLNALYFYAAKNKWAYQNNLMLANKYADNVKQLYINDSLISLRYHQLNNGKWNHMMDQTHIGYTYWQQPEKQAMPAVQYLTSGDESISDTTMKMRQADYLKNDKGNIFLEKNGYVSIEAAHFSKTTPQKNAYIKVLPDIGRTGDGVTVFPVTAAIPSTLYAAPKLEYTIYVYDTGTAKLQTYFSPTLNFRNDEGLKYAVSIDDELPQIIYINKEDNNVKLWNNWVANNIIIKTSEHHIKVAGKHILKCWLISSGAVLQKLVLGFGEIEQTLSWPARNKKINNLKI
ncbi:MAG: hypothetical protein WDM90_13805 [Ferruginibacter sp.]